MTTENLKIGTRGWRHPQWVGSYYPDDLPGEWQLTYYANDFRVVLVPAEYWLPSEGYDLEEWSDAVSDDFRFYLECPSFESETEMQHFQGQCAEMGGLLGGVMAASDVDVEGLGLQCDIVQPPSLKSDELCIGVIDKELDDLRKIRSWLEAFDKGCEAEKKIVFVTGGSKEDITMEAVMKIQTLSEMMGL